MSNVKTISKNSKLPTILLLTFEINFNKFKNLKFSQYLNFLIFKNYKIKNYL